MITTSKLNSSIVFSLAIFWGRGKTECGPRAEGRGTQTPKKVQQKIDQLTLRSYKYKTRKKNQKNVTKFCSGVLEVSLNLTNQLF